MNSPARRLILMRHAKSSWSSGADSDHDRPLNDRGRRDSPRMGELLVVHGWVPQLVLSSDSTRTRQTYDLMSARLDARPEVRFLPSLYHAGIEELSAALSAVDGAVETVLALGHNPGWEEALEWLCGESPEMKTAYAALLTIQAVSWPDSLKKPGLWTLERMLTPRD